MDMNELSNNMYKNIPFGGYLFTIDKIGLRLPTYYINHIKAKGWLKDMPVTIIFYGNVSQINIHAEFQPLEKHLGKKCLNAILILLFNGVFNSEFNLLFNRTFRLFFPYILFSDSLVVLLLSRLFKIIEWENAIDFLDISPFTFIKIDENNNKSFRKFYDTIYSKDCKKTRRITIENNKKYIELKGVQKSLICGYDKGKKIQSERQIYRLEIKFQGKYQKYLIMNYLNGTAEEAFIKMLPILKTLIIKIIEPDALLLNEYWMSNTPDQYKQLFS